ncbi:MAG: hypothetical protein NMK33_00640 [Candidatus Cardinium sp.]|uniref:putative zinc-binding metallopeptidase n=1 Tax=Cardinium endosymbiont of Dermatophagoides farinae TaxID=2597823 RepID=UPI001183C490|nr:putative zinc-binding metallopeptidase [Cardinium endosymbiont of Dermatophagoides farinae]TSJ81033.1 hypothetical protein FPG78_03320 [Cardinium endosymbiont of Dermatophagoides farinae]UWW97060.1 MAG: hypothetical protein NMK33_00640 [Candidatus Cardinium sp.]
MRISFDLFDLEPSYSSEILDYAFIICTMIHEFGHYLEMHNDQQSSLRGDSILKINSIVRKFKTMSESNAEREGAYVTEYAKTSWDEDFADTFAYFVLLDECPEPGVSILGDKVRLFYKYPEFVEIRESIRANIRKLGIHPNMSRDELKKLDIYPSTSDTN